MQVSKPCVSIGDLVMAYSTKSECDMIGLVISVEMETNVYVRSNYAYSVLWGDYPEPISHSETEVCAWRERYLNAKEKYK